MPLATEPLRAAGVGSSPLASGANDGTRQKKSRPRFFRDGDDAAVDKVIITASDEPLGAAFNTAESNCTAVISDHLVW